MADFLGKHMIYDLALKRPLTFNIQTPVKHSRKSAHTDWDCWSLMWKWLITNMPRHSFVWEHYSCSSEVTGLCPPISLITSCFPVEDSQPQTGVFHLNHTVAPLDKTESISSQGKLTQQHLQHRYIFYLYIHTLIGHWIRTCSHPRNIWINVSFNKHYIWNFLFLLFTW